MKLTDLLLESPTDSVARFYKESSLASERAYNPENVKYKEQTREYYDKNFKSWYENEITPVFMKSAKPAQAAYSNRPEPGQSQSPGFRGLQHALKMAGLPHDPRLQKYDPNVSVVLPPEVDGLH